MLMPYVTKGFGCCVRGPVTHHTSIMLSVSSVLGLVACAVLLQDHRGDQSQLQQCLVLCVGEATALQAFSRSSESLPG